MPPQEPNWQMMLMNTYQLTLGKRGGKPNETYIANVQLYQLPPLASEHEFKKVVSQGRLSEPDTGRFRLIKNDEELASTKGTWCVRYHTVSEDKAAKTPTGPITMLRDEYGYHCQHPSRKNVGVFFSYSLRHNPGDGDEELGKKANEFLEQVLLNDKF
jgi:hypothetical protein